MILQRERDPICMYVYVEREREREGERERERERLVYMIIEIQKSLYLLSSKRKTQEIKSCRKV
jgi:hypothetical protein